MFRFFTILEEDTLIVMHNSFQAFSLSLRYQTKQVAPGISWALALQGNLIQTTLVTPGCTHSPSMTSNMR